MGHSLTMIEKPKASDLAHIPGDAGWPIFGNFFQFTGDTLNYFRTQQQKHGDVFKARTPLGYSVMVAGPTANKLLLVDNKDQLSNQGAWEQALGELFPNGLMLLDGDRHKTDRSIILEAFKPEPMQGYLDVMPDILDREFDQLSTSARFDFFPFFKELTLKIAAHIFFGFGVDHDLSRLNRELSAIVDASTSLPINLPRTTYRRGLEGRAYMVDYFREILPERRQNPGRDLFSRLCVVENELGERLTDQQIVDHLIFILMAAHDTTAITLSWMSYFLAQHPDWQQTLRAESENLAGIEHITLRDLRQLEQTGLFLKETLRLNPPLILIPRQLTVPMTVNEIELPAGITVNLLLQMTQIDERVWDHPDRFDPERFSAERKEQNRCPFAYMPFGAGQHHCIGFAFAEMSVKLAISKLLNRFELVLPAGYEPNSRMVPMQQPVDGLPLGLKRLGSPQPL